MAAAVALAALVAFGGTLASVDAAGMPDAPALAAVEDTGPEQPAPATCVADVDGDKDTADRDLTTPPTAWVPPSHADGAISLVRALAPQFAAPPPQRPPRLAA